MYKKKKILEITENPSECVFSNNKKISKHLEMSVSPGERYTVVRTIEIVMSLDVDVCCVLCV